MSSEAKKRETENLMLEVVVIHKTDLRGREQKFFGNIALEHARVRTLPERGVGEPCCRKEKEFSLRLIWV